MPNKKFIVAVKETGKATVQSDECAVVPENKAKGLPAMLEFRTNGVVVASFIVAEISGWADTTCLAKQSPKGKPGFAPLRPRA